MRHDASWLRDYLVAGVEDPRLNLQSILSRHFIARAVFGSDFDDLMAHEIRFSAVMNWLISAASQAGDREILHAILHALQRQADNAEGTPIPPFVAKTFALLPTLCGTKTIGNYIEQFLTTTRFDHGRAVFPLESMDTFQNLWALSLLTSDLQDSSIGPSRIPQPLAVLEPACGSANDYRFFDAFGLARFINYTGFDLCSKNIQNAAALFPGVQFQIGNVFDIQAQDENYDLCLVHDLLEHLSLQALPVAVKEICRVTRCHICLGFFQMEEIADHLVRPLDDYYWNLLSMARMRDLFGLHGFSAQVIHVGTFLRQTVGCDQTHNPNAYTFFLRRIWENP
jgi:hypothetical protein